MARKHPVKVQLKVSDVALRDVFSDVVRVHKSHRDFARAGEIIRVNCKGKHAYAVARGPVGVGKTGIAMDLALRERLNVNPGEVCDFEFTKAGPWGQLCWAWRATDAMPRIAARLGVLSVILGLIGLILGIISLLGEGAPASVTVRVTL